jgi:S-DNA-T family DNA segregation ATPase FtsK/SpoIIIE
MQQLMMGPQQQQGYNPYAQQQQQPAYNPYTQQQPPQQQNTLQLSNAPGQYQQPQQQQYQQPAYNPYVQQQSQTYTQASQPQVASPAVLRSSGPSQAIVGRSSQLRGTPNVMRRATGGIVSLLDKK